MQTQNDTQRVREYLTALLDGIDPGDDPTSFGDWSVVTVPVYGAFKFNGAQSAAAVVEALKRDKRSVRDLFDPPQAKNSYHVVDGRLVWRHEVQPKGGGDPVLVDSVVANFEARLVGDVIEPESDRRVYTIEGVGLRGGKFTCQVDAKVFAEPRELRAALAPAVGPLDQVNHTMLSHLPAAIAGVTSVEPTRTTRYRRVGWLGRRFLVPGREPSGVEIVLARKMAYAVGADGDLGQGLTALKALLDALKATKTAPILAYILGAPLARVAGWQDERFALFIAGQTGSLKTSYVQAGLALYGPGLAHEENLIKLGEGTTKNAAMAHAAQACDAPLLIDNYKPNVGQNSRDIVNLIHALIEGSDKDRLNRNSELRDARPVHTWPIFTGEDVPASEASTLARLVVVPFERYALPRNEDLAHAQAAAAHLNAVGAAWLTWLESDEALKVASAARAQLDDVRAQWNERIYQANVDAENRLRMASNLAVLELAWRVACQHPDIGAVLTPYTEDLMAGLQAVASEAAHATSSAVEAVSMLEILKQLLANGSVVILSSSREAVGVGEEGRVIGWRDDVSRVLYILPDVARQVVERVRPGILNGVSTNKMSRQFDDHGLIAQHDDDRLLKSIKRGDQRVRVWCLHLKVIEGDPDGEE